MTQRTVKANPTKAFFVRMLTRDISLSDCILDLIDNAVDSAWKNSGTTPHGLVTDDSLAKFGIEITLSEESFSISDNCGGINFDVAAEYAFTFGREERDEDELGDEIKIDPYSTIYSIGVYGIGMKRAIFKLGNAIDIISTYDTGTQLQAFKVPIIVSEWLAERSANWDFTADDTDAAAEAGLSIRVTDLNEAASQQFGSDAFHNELEQIISRDYMIPLRRGLRISVNSKAVRPWIVELLQNDEFKPLRAKYDDSGVEIDVIAGMLYKPPLDSDPDPESDSKRRDLSGWYVACNGRIVLAADRTELSGWSKQYPKWHPQYAGFVGFVLFAARDPSDLPMTTTKRSVDVSSGVYRRALPRMKSPARAWIDYTNDRKGNIDELEKLETHLTGTDIFDIEEREEIKVPARKGREPRANVNYSVAQTRMRALAEALGDPSMSYKDVGIKTFETVYRDVVG